eukprot:768819-Hanusia_phi.AAC.3
MVYPNPLAVKVDKDQVMVKPSAGSRGDERQNETESGEKKDIEDKEEKILVGSLDVNVRFVLRLLTSSSSSPGCRFVLPSSLLLQDPLLASSPSPPRLLFVVFAFSPAILVASYT